jgi:cobalt-precorrin-5B (C1)-methyltransferase
MLRHQRLLHEVEIILPRGEVVRFHLQGQKYDAAAASCFVVKDAGDDPDVTNGAEVHAEVALAAGSKGGIAIMGGTGIGRVTKPGLAVPVGEWAINPVPRSMIEDGVSEAYHVSTETPALRVTISIPNGEALANRTLNARLGIVGGLSILGTTGIVKPISAAAWTDTIDSALDVALAGGCETVVLSTGRTSETIAQQFLVTQGKRLKPEGNHWPEEGFVMMGDYFGHAMRSCAKKGCRQVVIAGQFAKLLKIACGHEQTHVSSSTLDLQQLAAWVADDPDLAALTSLVRRANTARQVMVEAAGDSLLAKLVAEKAAQTAHLFAPAMEIKVLMAGYDGKVLYFR